MSTSILSNCPHCEATLKFQDPEFLGKKARCPSCKQPFVVRETGRYSDEHFLTDEQQPIRRKSATRKPRARRSKAPRHSTADGISTDTGQMAQTPASSTRKRLRRSAPPSLADSWLTDDLDTYDSQAVPTTSSRSEALPAAPRKKKPRKRRRKKPSTQEQSTFVSVLLAMIGGSVAAAIGGVAWIGLAMATGYEIGILAWGIGGLVGFGVILSSRDHIVGDLTGIIAAVIALLAVTLPKILLYMLVLAVGAGGQVGLGDVFSLFDLLWVFLATTTAFKVGSGQAGDD